jgi:hypothetical protein
VQCLMFLVFNQLFGAGSNWIKYLATETPASLPDTATKAEREAAAVVTTHPLRHCDSAIRH